MITFKQYINSQNETENNLYQTYKSSIHDAYEVAVKLINSNNDVPQHLIDSISKSLKLSLDIAKKLIKKHIEVPKQLINTIKSTGTIVLNNLLFYYISINNNIFPDIPQEFIDRIKEDDEAMIRFINNLKTHSENFNINNQTISEIKKYQNDFEIFLKNNPEFLTIML